MFARDHRPGAVPARGAAARRRERRRPERALPPRRLDAADQDRGAASGCSRWSTSSDAAARGLARSSNRELEVVELGSKIQSQVQSEMEKGQREYFLRQQLKAIQDELGEGDDAAGRGQRAARAGSTKIDLPEDVREGGRPRAQAAREAAAGGRRVRRHPHLPRLDPDAAVGQGRRRTTSTSRTPAQVLDEDHFDLEKVKERIIEHLAVSKLKNDLSGPILCFVGPPGRRQDLARPVDRPRARPQVRPHLGRRRARRGGDPRAPPHLHRRDARDDHPRAPRRRVDEPACS